MKKIIIFLFLIFMSFSIWSNDSVVTKGSESVVINYNEKDISIEKEELNIYFYKDMYRVTVEYEYINNGAERSLEIGFPIKYYSTAGEIEKDKFISMFDFSQVFNGEEIQIKEKYNVVEKNESYNMEGTYWITRNIKFKSGKNLSKIEYTGPFSQVGFDTTFDYIIETASCWNHKIKNLQINIHNDNAVLLFEKGWNIGSFNAKNFPVNYKVLDNTFYFSFSNVEPKEFGNIHFVLEDYNFTKSRHFENSASGWCYNLYHIYADNDEIWLYTKEQLQLFINCFYASKGYVFKNPDLASYFKDIYFDTVDGTYTKYTPDPNFNENKFNSVEKDNIQFLTDLKNKLYK